MMQYPLTLTSLLERAGKLFPGVEIVSRLPDDGTPQGALKSIHRYTYRDFHSRARALCAGLRRAGLHRGHRVGTLMWNRSQHLECYFGIPAAGGVVHTLNLRLHPDELTYIANHAGDRFLIVDECLLDCLERFRAQVKFERIFVVRHSSQSLPQSCEDYETLIQSADSDGVSAEREPSSSSKARGRSGLSAEPWINENEAAAMCYTSGTTGQPKGVVYSHRALALHSLSISLPDHFNIARRDVILPAMSMFHANAWGLPFAAVMAGCKLVFPGHDVSPVSLLNTLEQEAVTLTGAVPTVWLAVLDCLEREPQRWKLQPGLRILVAGSAAPERLFRGFDKFGAHILQPWGMTETTPMCTFSVLKPHMHSLPDDEKYAIRARQGLPSPFIDLRAVNEEGEIPWDGVTTGELQVRGPWVTASYFNLEKQPDSWVSDHDERGSTESAPSPESRNRDSRINAWLKTGDVVNIDAEGYIKITDRAKDLIKSGGEWISSVDLENALVAHESVKEAAVISVAHPKWQERPLALVVLHQGAAEGKTPTKEELREFLSRKFAKWQLPDDFVVVSELPHTSTGKLLKTAMRAQYKDWYSR